MPEISITLKWLHYLLMAAGGGVLMIAVGRWAWSGRRDPLRGSPIRANTLTPLMLWLCFLLYSLAGLLCSQITLWVIPANSQVNSHPAWQSVLASALTQIITIACLLAVARFVFTSGWRGFGFGRCYLRIESLWATGGLLVSICVCGLILWATQRFIEHISYVPPDHSVFKTLKDSTLTPWMHLVSILGAIILSPIGEELLFRGILQTGIRQFIPPRRRSMYHRWIAIGTAAVLFGLMHWSMPHHVPALIALGVILGYLYERTGSLTAPILVHMLFNAKTMIWYHLTLLG